MLPRGNIIDFLDPINIVYILSKRKYRSRGRPRALAMANRAPSQIKILLNLRIYSSVGLLFSLEIEYNSFSLFTIL